MADHMRPEAPEFNVGQMRRGRGAPVSNARPAPFPGWML